jgi:hypothetical protein
MKLENMTLRQLALIAGTRGMLGAGIGLLAAGRLSDTKRRTVGRTLMLIGGLSTIPLARRVFGHKASDYGTAPAL